MTNPYFQNLTYAPEQDLLDDVVAEAVSIHGIAAYYLPRAANSVVDPLYTENPRPLYADAIELDVYVKNSENFAGDGTFMSQFGVQIRDQVVFTVSRRTFEENVGVTGIARPREGDLIWFTPNQKLYEIKYTEKWPVLYPLGTLPTYDLTCELIEWSGQRLETGVAEIDAIEARTTQDELRWALRDENGAHLVFETGDLWAVDEFQESVVDPLDSADEIAAEAGDIIDFDEANPFTERWA